jgi:formate-dependent nitrite reductase cytochrome c552 subunit
MKRESLPGYLVGLGLMLVSLTALILPQAERLRAPGPMNAGHAPLVCQDCHRPAGTLRQQLQANLRQALGWSTTGAAIGHEPVRNAACLACHARADDAHSVSRFFEPRFEQVRRELGPQRCGACHREHQGVRVTVPPTFCNQCHQEVRVANERISIPHQQLAARGQWQSCLGCHDYHGNHVMQLRTLVEGAIPIETLRGYFAGDPSPYSAVKKHPARRQVP